MLIGRIIIFQLYRSLRVPISSRMLSDILSRLVETVAEQGEDMQVRVLKKRLHPKLANSIISCTIP
jgi:hypothetical protein